MRLDILVEIQEQASLILHFVQTEDRLHTFCHQLCDQHAAENEEAMRSVYTVKPPAIIWR